MSDLKVDSPVVSVIIPTFNRASLLQETLVSIREQDFGDYEVIVVDDGSTDETTAVLDQLEPTFGGRLARLEQPNAGEARAVNRGWAIAKGEFVIVVSSDDPQPPELLSTSVEFMRLQPSVLVCYPDWTKIDESGRVIEAVQSPDFEEEEFFVSLRCPAGPGACIRRAAVLAIRPNLRHPIHHIGNDLEAWMTIASRGEIRRLPRTVAQWRSHSTGTTSLTNAVSWQAGRVGLAYEFFSRPDLPKAIREYEDRCKRRQLALLLQAALGERRASRLSIILAAIVTKGAREAMRSRLGRLRALGAYTRTRGRYRLPRSVQSRSS